MGRYQYCERCYCIIYHLEDGTCSGNFIRSEEDLQDLVLKTKKQTAFERRLEERQDKENKIRRLTIMKDQIQQELVKTIIGKVEGTEQSYSVYVKSDQ